MNKICTEKIPTMGVGLRGSKIELFWNPKFFGTMKKFDHKLAILKHEILHIILQHITRGVSMRDKQRANIAMDLVVNQIIGEDQLPKDEGHKGTYIREFQGKYGAENFPTNETVDFYYKKLKDVSNEDLGMAPEHHWVIVGDGEGDSEGEGMKMKVISDQNLSDAQKTMLEAQAKEMVERAKSQASDSWGNLPGNLKSLLDDLLSKQKPQLPWKVILKRFVAKANKSCTTFTMKRFSRRFGVRPGLKKQQKLHLLLAVDTSGSVADDQYVAFFGEINGMHRAGCDVTVAECDHGIQAVYPYKPKMKLERSGYGGTSFDPVFSWVNEERMARKIDAILYLTDGYACEPTIKVKVPVLFVLTTDGAKVPGFKNLVLPNV